jgi:tRNA threonylcarbamoyladenosine biosynthesis protein TsaE
VADTEALGARLGEASRPGDVLLLEGPLGAGKTVLARGIARGLGVAGEVSSPTFVLVHQHLGRLPLVHADLYRLESRAEIDALGLLELAEDGVLVVEWADRAPWLGVDGAARLVLTPAASETARTLVVVSAPAHLGAVVDAAP